MPEFEDGTAQEFRRVFYVEDDIGIQSLVRFALEELAGLVVEVADSGKEALAKIPRFLPDLILLDVMMPDMDGFQTFAALRKLPCAARVPVVFVTAAAESFADRCPGDGQGILGMISKPFDPLSLPGRLRELWQDRAAS